MKQTFNLLSDNVKKLYLRYLLPSISATLVTSIYVLADTILIGKGVGADGLAALNIILPIFTLFFGTGILFGSGGAVLMSVSFGQQDERTGKELFSASVFCVAVMAVFYQIVFTTGCNTILRCLGGTDKLHGLAYEYTMILAIGAPIFLFSSMLQAFVRNDKAPTLAMIGVVAGGISNIVLDYIFIFKLHMGMRGGAIATVIGSGITVSILCAHFFSPNNHLTLVVPTNLVRKIGKIILNGLASFFVEIGNGIIMWIFNIQLLKYVGTLGVTVYGIISNSAIVAMSLANGVAQAGQPIIAINYGADKKDRVRETMLFGSVIALCVGALLTVVGIAFPEEIAKIFIKVDEAVLAMARPAVRIYFISFVGMVLNIFFSNYFQASMEPQKSLLICLLRGVILSSILVLTLPVFFGVMGIWWVMPITELVTFLVAIILFVIEKQNKV